LELPNFWLRKPLAPNPAVTFARAASNTFAGIRPADAPGFVIAQLLGPTASTAVFSWLVPALPKVAGRVVQQRREAETPLK